MRETLLDNTEGSTGTKDNYSVTYQESNTNPHTQGAPGGGTIINTRREKALVTVYKFWRNPDGLSQIDQAKVQLKLSASASESGNAEELEVYDPEEGSYDVLTGSALTEAQTATGFTATIPTGQKSYYVNIYDKNGLPYDMKTATMTEIVTLASNATYTQDGNTITLGTGLDAVTYKVTTQFKEERSYPNIGGDSNEMKRYQYEQFNTISTMREYGLIKTWSLSKTDAETERYRANIEQVEMQLRRCLLKDLNKPGTSWTQLGTYYLKPTNLTDWKQSSTGQTQWESTVQNLPKYDDDGNAYYYAADETGFVVAEVTSGAIPSGATYTPITVDNVTKYLVPISYYNKDTNGWGHSYFRDEEKTRVDNHDSPGSGYFTITKSWKDNNDAGRPAIKIRIYKRTELAAAIEALIAAGHLSTDNVDWSALDARVSPITPVGTAENPNVNFTVLNSANNYTVYPTFLSLCNNDESAAVEDKMANYVVLEYMLGKDNGAPTPSFDGQTPASYTYEQLANLASTVNLTSAKGTVGYDDTDDAKNRDYNVTNTRSSDTFYILNERTGTTTLTLNKTWHDENNRDGLRPDSVEFLLYQDGEPCKQLDGVTFTITQDNGNENATVTAKQDANGYTGTITVTCDVSDGKKNTAGKWTITVNNLPMFSGDSGTLYAYNIDEENDLGSKGDRTVHYLQSRGVVDSSTQTDQTTGTTQHFTINLKNTVAGITSHTAFKYWMDYSVEPKTLRPELVFTLYRYRKADYEQLQESNTSLPTNPTFLDLNGLTNDQQNQIGFKKVLNHNDPVVTTNDNKLPGPTDAGQPYDRKPYSWKIDISDLQRFDSEGREYVYVLQEQMSDGGETVRGTYVPTIYRTTNNRDDVFINTITGYLTLSGVKIWNGHESYQLELKDLPEPDVTLYRTTDDALSALSDLNQKTNAEIEAYKSAGELLELDKIHMGLSSENYKNKYVFPSYEKQALAETPLGMERVDGKLMLPKYDVNGQRYTYLMRETLGDDDNAISNILYARKASSGTLVNTLNTSFNKRTIKIYKSWQDRLGDNFHSTKYPSVTFYLYRYVVDEEHPNVTSGAKLYATKTINAVDFSPAENENGKECCKFENLLVYSPKGERYGYYVVEKKINGYKSELSLTVPTSGAGAGSGTDTGDGPDLDSETDTGDGTGTGSGSGTGTGSGTDTNGYLLFSDAANWKSEDGINNELYAKNTYTPSADPLKLTGHKVWDDWHDVAGLRPSLQDFGITLKRSTTSEAGQDNEIKSHEVTIRTELGPDVTVPTDPSLCPWIRWKTTGETDAVGRDQWTYEIGGLPRYAPNGQPYLYTITEKNQYQGYKDLTSTDIGVENTDEENESATMKAISNSLELNYTFRKYWHDGSNAYHMRPSEITIVLQYSTDDGSTWKDMVYDSAKYNLNDGKNPQGWFAYTDSSHTNALAVKLTAKNCFPKSNPNSNTWEYKFTNLPSYWKVNEQKKPVKYRCVEVKVGSASVNYGSTALQTKTGYEAGGYKAQYLTLSNDKTEVDNLLTSAKLKVTKVWSGDQNDQYQSRPDSLTFKLQKRVTYTSGGTVSTPVWEDVKKSDGSIYTFKLKKSDVLSEDPNKWERTLEDLPVSGTDESGAAFTLEFRAVELHDPENGTTVQGAENYVDVTDYDHDTGYSFDSSTALNTSVITNELRTEHKSITANKVWYASSSGDDTSITAAFVLQYKKKSQTGEDAWQNLLTQQLSKTANGTSVSLEPWTDLPTYDREGNELEYRIIEQMGADGHPVAGYALVSSSTTYDAGAGEAESAGDGDLDDEDPPASTPTPPTEVTTFVNVELQTYTVTKTWNKPGKDKNNVNYIPDADNNGGFTSTFVLQQKIGDGAWTDCTPPRDTETGTQTLTENGSYTWHDLPKYTREGITITYRAVETKINGQNVTTINGNDTDGNYIVTYDYDGTTSGKTAPAFDDIRTDSANRLVYGFVNLSKEAAYLAPGVTDLNADLSGVEFKIQDASGSDYVTGIVTDSNGNLTRNADGTYGTEHRYLVPGTYTLLEVSTHNDYSLWDRGVEFTVGLNGSTTDTGEHGTAWISTDTTTTPGSVTLKVTYLHPTNETTSHSFNDSCAPGDNENDAYNLESRGVIEFTKKGLNGANLDTHTGSSGETPAYFGVYTDAACTTQVAGMTAKSDDKTAFVLTDTEQDGTPLTAMKGEIPYLRQYGDDFTLLSGTYYVKELVAPAGYKVDTTVRTVTIDRLQTPMDGTNLVNFYVNNKGSFTVGETTTTDYQWPNTPNKVTIYKMDQFGRHVTLKDGGYLELTFVGGTFPTGESTILLYQNAGKPATKADGTQVGNESGKWSISYTYNNTSKIGSWTIIGLFAMGKQYTLREPDGAAPDENIQAKPITFTIGGDGRMSVANTDTHTMQSDAPTTANGAENDYKNYYQPNAENNQVVLRDVARFRKNVALKKVKTGTSTVIPNISFNLFHKESDTSWKQVNVKMVNGTPQETGAELTTNASGEINLASLTDATLINSITGAPLSNGLDLGDYYFEEVEAGASDKYRLANKICFSIVTATPNNPESSYAKSEDYYADFAKVQFTSPSSTGSTVSQSGDQGTVENTPAKDKSLILTKVDAGNNTKPLAGAKFELNYQSINKGQTGANPDSTTYAMTDTDGALKTARVSGDNWTIGANAPDISAKGTYTLMELRASPEHMTYTANGTTTTPVMLSFKVGSDNEITDVSNTSGYTLNTSVGAGDAGDLTVTVKNNKTVVTIDKLNDLYQNTKTENQHNLSGEALTGAKLEIYEGVGTSGKLPISQNYTSDAGAGEGAASGDGPSLDDDDDGSSGTSGAGAGFGTDSSDHDLGDEDGSSSGSSGGGSSGDGSSGTPFSSPSVTSGNTWTLTGVLSENTVYTLHEKEAPVGFLEANDLYFCLFGTRSTGSGNAVESQLYVWIGSGDPPATVTPEDLIVGNKWSKARNPDDANDTTNLDADNDLTMVDEAIIAPVDARKVLDTGDTPLAGVTFDVFNGDDNTKLGTVVSGSDGHLTWQSHNANGLIYTSAGKRVTAANEATDEPVILQQNAAGYIFKEASAPINAYNKGIGEDKEYRVKITDQNYKDYKAETERANWAVDLVDAENNSTDHTADLKDKTSATKPVSDLVNPAYHSTVKLFKYDSDPEAGSAAIPGTEFTLYQGSETTPYAKAWGTGGSVQTSGKFTTDASGNLSITIPEKGSYTLRETTPSTGYSGTNSFTFTLADKAENGSFGYDTMNTLQEDTTGVPNARQYGDITLTKTDAAIDSVKLNGVKYTLERTGNSVYFTGSQTVETGKTYTASYVDTGAARTCTLTEQLGQEQPGTITISNLDWGTYTLTETTELSGYKLDTTPIEFVIGQNTRSVSREDKNQKNEVKFKKTESGSSKGLSGAVFEVRTNASNASTAVEFYLAPGNTSKVKQATSDANGVVTVYGLPTNPNSDTATTYHLVEVTAPAGYVLNPTPVTFSIDRYGNVKMGDSSVSEVPMADKPIRVTLKKLGETGTDTLNGAEFTLTPDSGSSFVDGSDSKELTLTDGTLLIEKNLIGGNSYILEETKAPDGYEATAKIYFTVATDGQVTITSTTGGYVETGETECCTANNEKQDGVTEEYKSTLTIRDEKIRVTLTKEDRDNASIKLDGVTFTLTPCEGSSFASGFESEPGLSESGGKTVFTATTATVGADAGVITIPEGLLVHGCQYLLQETVIGNGQRYYLGKEAQDGVILNVAQDGSITVERLTEHNGKTVNGVSSCPVSVNNTAGHVQLTAKNPKAAAFEFTKDVAGNMGDVTGEFTITMEVYEPDYKTGDAPIATKAVTLKNGESYSSLTGKTDKNGTVDASCKFDSDSFPVGAKLKIIEDEAQDYKAKIVLDNNNAVIDQNEQGVVWLTLNGDWEHPASFTLTNTKNVSIDAGVVLEQNAPYALIAIAIPALWLYLRARRRRKGGGDR